MKKNLRINHLIRRYIFILATSAVSINSGAAEKPLFFDVVNKGVKFGTPVLEYSLDEKTGNQLQLGPLQLQEDFFSVNLTSRQKLDADGSKMAFYNQEDMVLFFDWPKELIQHGTLDVSDDQGKTLWTTPLGDKELAQWKEKILQVKEQLRKQGKTEHEIEDNALLKKTYAFFRSKTNPGPELKVDQKYKFCLKNTEGESFAHICTPFYVLKTAGTQIEMNIQSEGTTAEVRLQNAPQAKSAKLPVTAGQVANFSVKLKSGALIEFASVVPALTVYDMMQTKDAEVAQIAAENPAPVFMASVPLHNDNPLDPINKLWQGNYKLKDKKIFLPGVAGGFFQYDVTVDYLPTQKQRLSISDRFGLGTYSARDKISVRRDDKKSPDTWTTQNPLKNSWNRSYAVTKDDKHDFQSYLDLYRGYAGEASLRLTGLASLGGKTAVMAEAHLSYWFNSIAGWDQYYLSRQRWGLSAKYVDLLSTISAVNEDGTTEDVKIQSMIADLKYRFTPGLWERDETWGAMLSYENLTYADFKIPKLGYGIFWARSMPKFFDDIFNYFTFMRYPKWVDLELIKYATSLDSNYTLGDDYAINFHGKILWKPWLYGEAGFGAKKYYFKQKTTELGASLDTVYGTLGLGINF